MLKKLSNLIGKLKIIITPQEKWQVLVLFASILLAALFQTLGVIIKGNKSKVYIREV